MGKANDRVSCSAVPLIMECFAHSIEGLIHFVTAMIALVSGTIVLAAKKGTRFHKQWAYVYFVSMTVMIVTCFMIYRLFAGFGIFHYGAILSSLTLMGGFVPVIARKLIPNWLEWHFSMMYWSAVGLYAAFFTETLTRIPHTPFFAGVGITFLLTMIVAGFYWRKLKVKWSRLFSSSRFKVYK